MKIKDYLIFFRVQNLLMIILIQLLLKYVLFQDYNLTTTLNDFQFGILIFSTVLITLAGYIINDINDVESDLINKPDKVFVSKKMSLKTADTLFLVFNFLGLISGYYLAYSINKVSYFSVFIIGSLLSYLYSIKLKRQFYLKNIIVAFLVFLSIFIVGLFDIVPATSSYNNEDQLIVFNILLKMAAFAFLLTLIRELVKDLMDYKGDAEVKTRTIPVAIGVGKAKVLAILIAIFTLIAVSYFGISIYDSNPNGTYYLFSLVCLPMIYFILKLSGSFSRKDYSRLSNLLKIVMLLGILIVFLL